MHGAEWRQTREVATREHERGLDADASRFRDTGHTKRRRDATPKRGTRAATHELGHVNERASIAGRSGRVVPPCLY
jgi:hypothetical protein